MLPSRNGSDSHGDEAISIAVCSVDQVGEARRAAAALAVRFGFSETDAGKTAIVVSEAATNLARHAGEGEIVLTGKERHGRSELHLLALDKGPGISNLPRCLADGYSTSGTSGTGLGAITRLSQDWAIYSQYAQPPLGTVLYARIHQPEDGRQPPQGQLDVGDVALPKMGESVNGDAWSLIEQDGRCLLLAADGLGHGPSAAVASQSAVRAFHRYAELGPAEILHNLHGVLRSTRGAAVSVTEIDYAGRQVRSAGVGNISGSIWDQGQSRSLVSHPGTLGHEIHRIQEFTYPFPPEAVLVVHSDGIGTQWRLGSYEGLVARRPILIAGVLYRDFKRGRDDVTIVVIRQRQEGR